MAQLIQVDASLDEACLPAMQSIQVAALVAAVTFDALPAAQLLHVADPTAACLPIGHAAHTEMLWPRALAYARPAAQLVQAAVAFAIVCLPAGHALHSVAVVVLEY